MRAPAWGGSPPSSDTEARQRLVDAARRCFDRCGTDKTTIADVAAEAGVGRRTVYRYFENSDELLRASFALAAGGIVERMIAHARAYREPGERLIEAMLFLLREVPADPRLGPLFNAGHDGGRSPRSLSSAVTMEVSHNALRAVLEELSPLGASDLDDLAELILRLLQSFLTEPGVRPRTEPQMRTFLRGWVLPAFELKSRASKALPRQPVRVAPVTATKKQDGKLRRRA